jgi:hypothetical protein
MIMKVHRAGINIEVQIASVLFVYSHLSNFSIYTWAIYITCDRDFKLDLCLALMVIAVRVLLCATPAATWDLILYSLIRRTGKPVPLRDSNLQNKDHQIFTPPL